MNTVREQVYGRFPTDCYFVLNPRVEHDLWEHIIDEINTPVMGAHIRGDIRRQVRE